ncbi:MAG TPA: hypothetical protein VKH81_14980 [Candidatus Angelobacter sp.]|nr:hypothetical protein [Candidatus Angelobacter sp.]
MKSSSLYFMLVLFCLGTAATVQARDIVVPAGTLMTCTLDEPKFSSATVSVGDPFLCYPRTMQQFGQIVFPRGTYMVGHLESDKEPGHFVGKGYLKLAFDRIGLPEGDIPLTAKVVAVAGFNVNKEGKVIGHGHATRDVVEWMLPPLWPWKVLTLPARGPRPTLKGEVRVTLRVMDDIFVPQLTTPGWHRFGEQPSSYPMQRSQLTQPRAVAAVNYQPIPTVTAAARQVAVSDNETVSAVPADLLPESQPITPAVASCQPPALAPAAAVSSDRPAVDPSPRDAWAPNVTLFALADGTVFPATQYWRNQDQLLYVSDNDKGTVSLHDIDWSATTRLNAARNVRVILRNVPAIN